MTSHDLPPLEEDLLETLARSRVLPLLDVRGKPGMELLARILLEDGIPLAELTLRRPGALDALRTLAEIPELLVGAGTVMTARQAGEAVNAGARFLVSPGYSSAVVAEAARLGVPLISGIATATEITAAIDTGARTVKFFPAEASGGPAAIRALSAVAPDVRWVPTGGVTPANAPKYLRHGCRRCGGNQLGHSSKIGGGGPLRRHRGTSSSCGEPSRMTESATPSPSSGPPTALVFPVAGPGPHPSITRASAYVAAARSRSRRLSTEPAFTHTLLSR